MDKKETRIPASPALPYTIWIPLFIAAGLIVYKSRASLAAIHRVLLSGALSTRAGVVSFGGTAGFLEAVSRSTRYFVVIGPALVFGVSIAAAVRTFVPSDWFARIARDGALRTQLAAGAAGAPLMLCSCCIVPVFTAVYEGACGLGPSLAVMLASPSLNPAALLLTGILFAPRIALARLLMAGAAVFAGSTLIACLFPDSPPAVPVGPRSPRAVPAGRRAAAAFLRSFVYIFVRTIPALAIGILCSTLLTLYMPHEFLSTASFRAFAVVATASIALPLALPTFFELPLALGFLMAGLPTGAVAVFLFAGPAINLPSLLALARATSWKIATALAAAIWLVAVTGGLFLSA